MSDILPTNLAIIFEIISIFSREVYQKKYTLLNPLGVKLLQNQQEVTQFPLADY